MYREICVALLALPLMQTAIPVPRQSSKAAAEASDRVQNKSDSNQPPSALSLDKKPIISITANPNGTQQADENKQQKIAVVALPEVPGARNYRGFLGIAYDWGPWVFAFLLVIVGLVQAGILKIQSNIMKNSLDASRKSAEAADNSSSAYRAIERARVAYMRTEHGRATDKNGHQGMYFKIFWKNVGRSTALNCSIVTQRKIVTDNLIPEFNPTPEMSEKTLAPLLPEVDVHGVLLFDQKTVDGLRTKTCRVFIYSRADYETVFPEIGVRHTEACMELSHVGTSEETGKPEFSFNAIGPQNSAT